MSGKGDGARPLSIPRDEFQEKYERIMPRKLRHCQVCGYLPAWCACLATDDGPGQDNEEGGKQ